jgi:hypothetical protein
MPMRNDSRPFDENEKRYLDATNKFNTDANESIFFARELEYVKSNTYDVKRPMLSALDLIPLDTSAGEGAEYITYRQYDTVGMAKIIANYANDLPRADVVAREFSSPVRGIGNSYGYSIQEIRAANMVGKSLDARKATAARRSQDEKMNQIAWSGDAEYNLPGFLTNANIPTYTVPADGTGSSKLWSNKTPDQILRDMNAMCTAPSVTTKGVHKVSELWLPLQQYSYIAQTVRSTASDLTILEAFKRGNPDVLVRSVVELEGAGAGATNRMVALERSAENFQLQMPMPFTQHSVQQKGLEFEVPCESRMGGVVVYYPLAFIFGDGI